MRAQTTTRFAALATLVGALACAGNTAKTDTDQAAAARDSTSARDTLNGQTQNPSGYRGMERDTTMVPPTQQTPTDTFLQRQGTGAPQDTAGYSGMERVDTTGQAQQGQNQGQTQTDTSGMSADTSSMSPSTNQSNPSSAGQSDSSYNNQNNPSSTGQSDSTSQSNPSSSNQSGTSSSNQSGSTSLDSTGMSKTGDTTGYGTSQQGQDSTSHQ
jgi:trimeric autotransporter adhesin